MRKGKNAALQRKPGGRGARMVNARFAGLRQTVGSGKAKGRSVTRDIFTFGLGLGAILLTAQAARAETPSCLDREDLAARLADQYGEQRQSAGLAGPDRLVEVFASPETGTWTIVVTSASGVSCLIAAGEHFTRFEGVKAGDPA